MIFYLTVIVRNLYIDYSRFLGPFFGGARRCNCPNSRLKQVFIVKQPE